MESLDDVLEATGCFGRFQLYMILALALPVFVAGWSMMQIQFIDLTPDFHCVIKEGLNDSTFNTQTLNSTLNVCSVHGTPCDTYEFVNTWLTTVTRWNLVCDRKWIKNLLQSLQLAGLLIGALLVGQLSDWYGRKKTLLGFVLWHSLSNFFAAFSFTWKMFGVSRMFLGIGQAGILALHTPYTVEFLSRKWRSTLLLIPAYSIGVSSSAGAEALLLNAVYLHFIVACLIVVALPGLILLPEGPRWLIVNGHVDKAEKVISKIAKINKKPVPENLRTLMTTISREGENSDGERRAYSFVHLFVGRSVIKVTCLGGFVVMCSAVVFTGISYGISGLAGNVFWNIFFMAFWGIPGNLSVIFLSNRLGRRKTSCFFFFLVTMSQAGCLLVMCAIPGGERELGFLVTVFCFVASVGVNSATSAFAVWIVELYPTVIRNVGYSFQMSTYYTGGLIAPFLIDLTDGKLMSFVVMGVLMLFTTFLVLALPETKDKKMADYTIIPSSPKRPNLGESDRLISVGSKPCYCADA